MPRKKGKIKRKRRENVKGEEENLTWKGQRYEKEHFFSFFRFCLSLFETTEIICLGCTKMKISTGKKHFTLGKKSGNETFLGSEK